MPIMEPEDFQAELDKREADQKNQAQSDATVQSIEKAKREVVASVIASTKATMQHRENTTTKVDVQNDLAETEDINRAVEAINNVAVLLLAQGQQKPSVNMIDGTDLGDRFNELGKTLTDLLTEVKNDTTQDDKMQTVVKQLDTFLTQLKALQVAPDPDLKKSMAAVVKALQKLDMKPTVNVSAPNVTATTPAVDVTPIREVLEAHFPPVGRSIDLSAYRAQDLDSMEPGVQYVGFVNPDGNWYIVKNVEADNTLRYAFGTDLYPTFWERASQLEYARLDEALHEI